MKFLAPDGGGLPGEVRDAWRRLDAANSHVYSMYQSLEWWDHLQSTHQRSRTRVAIVVDAQGRVAGVVPLHLRAYPLDFTLGRRFGVRLGLRAACILGGEPLIPEGGALHGRLYQAIWERFPSVNAIYMKGIPVAGRCWEELSRGNAPAIVYASHGIQDFFTITLPPTFDAYVAKFRRKQHYNLRRQVRRLRQAGGGSLDLVRVESAADVAGFVRDAESVAHHSWQRGSAFSDLPDFHEAAHFEDLARRDLLRCYLLRSAGAPCAYAIGYQSRGVFHYSDIGYDKRYASYSPGTVLLFLLIKDLTEHRSPRLLNFGIGDSPYKRRFATHRSQEASVLLLKRTPANRVRYVAHRTCRGLARCVRRRIPRPLTLALLAAQAGERWGRT